MSTERTRHPQSDRRSRRPSRALRRLLPLLFACCALSGCANFWDDITSREFHIKDRFKPQADPLWVIQNSPDGDMRERALRKLREPSQHGGTPKDQETVVQVLMYRAEHDPQPLCRLAAIQTLRDFRDPRVVQGLTRAYFAPFPNFNPETVTVIRCATLEALGATGNPEAINHLVLVLRQPRSEDNDSSKRQAMDERITAARALGNFKDAKATDALVGVLRGERDIALRDRASESLQSITNKDLPPDAQQWNDYLQTPQGKEAIVAKPSFTDKAIRLISFTKP